MRCVPLALLVLFVSVGVARAESPAVEPAYDSPRASIARFFALARAGQYRRAAEYLEVEDRRRAPELARKLVLTLDARVWVEVEALSGAPEGDTEDGLPRGVDEIARITVGPGAPQPVRIAKRGMDDRWVFTRQTCAQIDSWYAAVHGSRLLERLPAPMLRSGPLDILVYQWLALPVLVLVALLLGRLLGLVTAGLARRLAQRTSTELDDRLVERLEGPVNLGWALVLFDVALPWLGLVRPAERVIDGARDVVLIIVLATAFIRAIGVAGESATSSQWGRTSPSSRALVQIAARVGKFVVVALAFIMLLSSAGYDVGSLIAGLGIGGVIVALAAQKTVENLLGAFAIGIDQPLREGDFISVDGRLGTVERLGLRSTRIRTLDRTVVTVPNGRLADMTIETFAVRDRVRLVARFGVLYGTSAAQLRELRDRLEAVVREHPIAWQDDLIVRLAAFGESSFEFEVIAWFVTTEYPVFLAAREQVLLGFLQAIESVGTELAFPTRTLHVAGGAPLPSR